MPERRRLAHRRPLGVVVHRVEALLRALEAEGVGHANFLVAEEPGAVLLVALALELAGLEAEDVGEEHAAELGEDAHLHVLGVLHLVAGPVHEGSSLCRVMVHIDECENPFRLICLTLFDKLLHSYDLWL